MLEFILERERTKHRRAMEGLQRMMEAIEAYGITEIGERIIEKVKALTDTGVAYGTVEVEGDNELHFAVVQMCGKMEVRRVSPGKWQITYKRPEFAALEREINQLLASTKAEAEHGILRFQTLSEDAHKYHDALVTVFKERSIKLVKSRTPGKWYVHF